ncbi:kinase-like domain-containing protein [Boletus reticuloceps]|uniref:EKC/KEOPS complex subunit BUD32 n=1 Tax=Boletus reticuloceps TaxID=495285 RepID=A0A8I3A8M6_9AGAM|nr:kinase-like domain-containing protein [Boletus reticuloceps]
MADILFKHRFPKRYRHPTLDATLTRQRLIGEARTIMKCLRAGVNVPGIRLVDTSEGCLGLEFIEGPPVRYLIPAGTDEPRYRLIFHNEEDENDEEEPDYEEIPDTISARAADWGCVNDISMETLLEKIGVEIAKLHLIEIIHGDLTTSNMLLRASNNDLVLIDFGLAYHSTLVEDKAVDLYVLERAFASTHPDSESLFASILAAYADRIGKDWGQIKKRLDEVRLRGRKRSMVG